MEFFPKNKDQNMEFFPICFLAINFCVKFAILNYYKSENLCCIENMQKE